MNTAVNKIFKSKSFLKLPAIVQRVLLLIDQIERDNEAYEKINRQIITLQPEFSSFIQYIEPRLYDNLTYLFDEILGDDLASYYFFEPAPRSIKIKLKNKRAKVFDLNSVADLIKYISYRDKHQ